MSSNENAFSIFRETQKWCKDQNILCAANEQVSSTNDLAKTEAMKIDDDLKIYIADQQTAGRGRHSHTWSNTKPGDSLLCTWSFACMEHPQPITGPLFGLAIYTALQKTFRMGGLSVKPPNDIYLADKKIAGILAETIQAGQKIRLIVGFGLNVFSSPTNIDVAGHLSSKVKVTTNVWSSFLDELLFQMQEASRASQATHLTESQRDHLLAAINACPLKQATYMNVSPFGDLVFKDQTISWRDL